ncbi:HWE histidine kinase domain-containing protein [Sabulicella rubraurantiaca]|uniref:HWE histidine kinase domain-containing protein n=1 Tax=Sabulicella rubraurantiaca TaxID=2811429 RepID=UPI001A9639F2|nr:HWE histidine kinase domain-containing protein [Sabulicella rubraurantiaca]
MQNTGPSAPTPADLSICDREPIHLLGGIQPFGFLLAISPDWEIRRASANAAEWTGIEAEALIGTQARALLDGEAVHDIRSRLQMLMGTAHVESLLGLHAFPGKPPVDVAVHMAADGFVLEFERHVPEDAGAAAAVRDAIGRLQNIADFPALCRSVTRHLRALSGFDRVMMYRFDEDGSGEVVAEAVRAGLGSFLGQRFPASDIPRQARALYERNTIRVIADVSAAPIPIVPALDAAGLPLDLSMSVGRAVSPVHLEYLRNMDVAASLSVSILRQGRLWGLLACHNMTPRTLSLAKRSAIDFLGQMLSWLLESREREAGRVAERVAYETHARLADALLSRGSGLAGLVDHLAPLRVQMGADGLALCLGGRVTADGDVPSQEALHSLVTLLEMRSEGRVLATDSLGTVHPPAASFAAIGSGLLAVPLPRSPRDWILFFRKEAARKVTWAGRPAKALEPSADGLRLSPRKSFEAWEETVRGRSLPWGLTETTLAESLRVTLLEVALRLADRAERAFHAAQDRQELLIAELNHRVRNILNLTRGIVSQSRGGADSVTEFSRIVSQRIQALSRAHDQINDGSGEAVSLRSMILREAEAYLGVSRERLIIEGGDVTVEPGAVATLALVLHEMITNAAKYGALLGSHGLIRVTIGRDALGALVLDWVESGGPPVRAPSRRGFGSTIIERTIPHELNGTAELDYRPDGLVARFTLPAQHLRDGVGEGAMRPLPAAAPVASGTGLPDTVLLVEDNLIIALETEDLLINLGARSVETAASAEGAFRLLQELRPDLAILDFNLGHGNSVPVAERLQAMGVPFVFATGYGEASFISDAMENVPVLQKPFEADSLLAAFARLGTPTTARP